ncbi:MAG: metallophosphoesterase family protein [Gemmatimonadales bacterium]|nr:MAG: metallophosphoesterase family protein [Gemmatimonadales bacterium]
MSTTHTSSVSSAGTGTADPAIPSGSTPDAPAAGLTRGPALARWLLSIAVAAHAVGLFVTVWGARQTHLGNFLFMVLEYPHGTAVTIEKWLVSVFLALALAQLLRPSLFLLLPVAGYVLFEAWAGAYQGGYRYSEWTVWAQTLRWSTPLALAVLVAWPFARWLAEGVRTAATSWILRGAVAMVFVVHGLECLWGYGAFADLIMGSARSVLDLRIREAQALQIMQVIGVVDLLVAAAVLVRPWRAVLLWAAFWGAITAVSRMTALGMGAWIEVALRTSHVLGPLTILALRHPVPAGLSLPPLLIKPGIRPMSPGVPPRATARRMALSLLLLVAATTLTPVLPGGALLGQETIRPLEPSAQPIHLRVQFKNDPAREAVVSWSTTVPGTDHVIRFDTVPRGGDLEAYAVESRDIHSGAWTLLDEEEAAGMHGWYHHAPLSGLEPSTRYYLTVETDGETLGEYHFITAPADERPLALLSGGDSRVGDIRTQPDNPRRRMNARMAALVEEYPHVVALAHTADYTNRAYWSQLYFWLNDHFEMTTTREGRLLPIIPTRGNHDLDVGMDEMFWWPNRATDFYYTTRLGPDIAMVVLNTEISVAGDQRDWLEDQLMTLRPQVRWLKVMMHKPAYPSVRAFETGEPRRRAWVPLFEEFGVDFVAVGHDHSLKRTAPILANRVDPRGIVYVGDGGLGVRPREVATDRWYINEGGMSQSVDNVHLIEFESDRMRYRAFGMEGDLLDELEIPHDRAERAAHFEAMLSVAADR